MRQLSGPLPPCLWPAIGASRWFPAAGKTKDAIRSPQQIKNLAHLRGVRTAGAQSGGAPWGRTPAAGPPGAAQLHRWW